MLAHAACIGHMAGRVGCCVCGPSNDVQDECAQMVLGASAVMSILICSMDRTLGQVE